MLSLDTFEGYIYRVVVQKTHQPISLKQDWPCTIDMRSWDYCIILDSDGDSASTYSRLTDQGGWDGT